LTALASAIPEIWMGPQKFTISSAFAVIPCHAFVSKNLTTTNHPIQKRLQLINDLEVYMPKIIAIEAFR